MVDTVRIIETLSLVVITMIGVASVQAGTVHVGHTTVHSAGHGNYQGNYRGGNGYYAHGGSGYYARGGKGTTPMEGNGTTPTEGTTLATGAVGTMAANITTAATTLTTRPSL